MGSNNNVDPLHVTLSVSPYFLGWLEEVDGSLACTTFQAGKLIFIGRQPNFELSIFERSFNRCMGLFAHEQSLYMSSLYQLWRFENILSLNETHNGYDKLYVPQVAYTTGTIDIHDIALDAHGKVIFVNTLFSCLATVSETRSFIPIWKPSFISQLVPEDRCHLNGMAVTMGKVKYVSLVSPSDSATGWRGFLKDGGCVLDVESGEAVITGLSMPHSPRLYDGKLWLLDSGNGRFGFVDIDKGKFEEVCFCPGFLRGLIFYKNYAIVGVSLPRDKDTYTGLPLDEKLKEKNKKPFCGLLVIDMNKGEIAHWLRFNNIIEELYDVAFLPNAIRPMVIGTNTDEIHHIISIG